VRVQTYAHSGGDTRSRRRIGGALAGRGGPLAASHRAVPLHPTEASPSRPFQERGRPEYAPRSLPSRIGEAGGQRNVRVRGCPRSFAAFRGGSRDRKGGPILSGESPRMTPQTQGGPSVAQARLAGVLYLIIILCA